jgi:hypothetical protein
MSAFNDTTRLGVRAAFSGIFVALGFSRFSDEPTLPNQPPVTQTDRRFLEKWENTALKTQ